MTTRWRTEPSNSSAASATTCHSTATTTRTTKYSKEESAINFNYPQRKSISPTRSITWCWNSITSRQGCIATLPSIKTLLPPSIWWPGTSRANLAPTSTPIESTLVWWRRNSHRQPACRPTMEHITTFSRARSSMRTIERGLVICTKTFSKSGIIRNYKIIIASLIIRFVLH